LAWVTDKIWGNPKKIKGERSVSLRGIVSSRRFHRAQLGAPQPAALVRFDNTRNTAEQWVKESKQAVALTRLSCHRFRTNED
jgi:hypothetical protein